MLNLIVLKCLYKVVLLSHYQFNMLNLLIILKLYDAYHINFNVLDLLKYMLNLLIILRCLYEVIMLITLSILICLIYSSISWIFLLYLNAYTKLFLLSHYQFNMLNYLSYLNAYMKPLLCLSHYQIYMLDLLIC